MKDSNRASNVFLVVAFAWAASACTGEVEDDLAEPYDELGQDVEEAIGSQVCFPGPDGDGDQCWSVLGDPFNDGISNDGYYTLKSHCPGLWGVVPIAYFRQWKMDASTKVAPNFTLGELAQTYTDQQYLLLQPHAVESLQRMRDSVGAIRVTSGYRPPGRNYAIKNAAGCSRHMYGDGFDLVPLSAGVQTLANACTNEGGHAISYADGHVHCDFRYDAEDPRLFATAAVAAVDRAPEHEMELVASGTELTAPATGFDEGEPLRTWTAFDAEGAVIAEGEGARFTPPEEAFTVRVDVGGVLEATRNLRHSE